MKPQIIAVGNITKDITLEKTQKSSTSVVKFTIACNGGKDGETTFLWCIAYQKNAENIAKFFQKGSPIMIVGELSQYLDEGKRTHSFCDVIRWGFVGAAKREGPPPEKDNFAKNEPEQDASGEPF